MLLSRSLKLVVLGLAAPIALAGCDRQSDPAAQPSAAAPAQSDAALSGTLDRSHKGSEMPDMTVKDASGKALRLQSLKGKPLLINLWATWCAPCVVELPMLDQLAQSQPWLKVLTISQDMKVEPVAPFLAERGIKHLEPWLDPENDLSFHYQSGTLPTSVLYDAQGREVWRYVGGREWTSADTVKLLAEAR